MLSLIALFAGAVKARAAELDATLGVGMGKSVLDKRAFERFGTLGVRYGGTSWKLQGNGGYWLALQPGEQSSVFGSVQGGVEVVGQSGTFAQVMFGPALVQNPDSKLAGHFQFHLAAGAGVKNSAGYGLAFIWNHLSNAGLVQPNMGRDLLTAQLLIPLYKGE
jgi:hypothetical protein